MAITLNGASGIVSPNSIQISNSTIALSNNGVVFADGNTQPYVSVPVRQTVLNGPVDATGQSAFGGATGATTVTAAGTLFMTAANGMSNRIGSKANPSWPGLSANGTMYLYADVNVDGTITEGVGSSLPTYQWGGTPAVTTGLFTFNIQQMQGFIGNGTAAVAGYRVYIGEVTVAAGVVSAIVWYALMGRSFRSFASPVANTNYQSTHNIGSPATLLTVKTAFLDTSGITWESPVNGYTSGADSSTAYGGLSYYYSNRLGFATSTGTSQAVYGPVSLTFANCAALLVFVRRDW